MSSPLPYTQTTDVWYEPANSDEQRLVFIQTYRQLCGMPGESITRICDRLGIKRTTLYMWRRTDEKFARDMQQIEEANRAFYAQEAEEKIAEIMRSENPLDKSLALKAAMFMAQNLNSNTYGQRTKHEHVGTVTVTVPRPQRPDPSAIDVTPASPVALQPEPALPVWHGDGPYDPTIRVLEHDEVDEDEMELNQWHTP